MRREVALSRERRKSPRLPAVDNVILLSWPSPGGTLRMKGRMLDASETGVLIRSDVLPPLGQGLDLRMDRPVRTDWYAARVVRHGNGLEAGLRFEGCDPYALVLAGTLGIDIERSLIDLPDEHRFSNADN
jgi:hypothetical protein